MALQNEYDIEYAFMAIEDELIASMMRNMKRHRVEEVAEKKQWSMWQAEQLKSLEEYKKKNRKKFQSQFSDINNQIEKLLRRSKEVGAMEQEIEILNTIKKGYKKYTIPERIKAFAEKQKGKSLIQILEGIIFKRKGIKEAMTQGEFFKLNERKLEALIKATLSDMQKAEVAVLRMADDQYRKIIFSAQVYANTGAGTYEQSVDMASKDFLSRGINCIEYSNGARHTIGSYASMAIRTACKRAYLQGEGEKRQEWGISTVIVNKRGMACLKCLPFVGLIFIDDVWSGGKKTDGRYPLISTAIAKGLYHPNCKDSHTTYFEGITTPPKPMTEKEVEAAKIAYMQEQRKKTAERMHKKFNTLSGNSLDEESKKKYRLKANEWKERAKKQSNNLQ